MAEGKMKAAYLYGIQDLRIIETDIPDIGPGEVLVRVRAATTCGTDVKIYRRGYVGGIIQYPQPFGHEWAGDIAEVGEGVDWLEVGMRVRGGNSAPCYRCSMCLEGKYNLCENRVWLWGAYAEYVKVPAPIALHNMHILPPHLTYEEAAVTEPLACVVHGQIKAGVGVGDDVAIIGAGPIGLLHAQLARVRGARKVIVSDVVEERLRMAERMGVDVAINASEEDVERRVKEETNGLGADVVVEAVGLPQTWMQALKLVKRGGTVLEFGGCPPGTKIELDTELLHYGEVTVLGTFHATPEEFTKAFNLIASGQVDAKSIITRRMPLTELKKAMEILSTSKTELKIAIIP